MSLICPLTDIPNELQVELRKTLRFEGEMNFMAKKFGAQPKVFYFFKVVDGIAYIPYVIGLWAFPDYAFPEYPSREEFESNGPSLREFQEDVLAEAIPILHDLGSVILNVPTGTGKGKLAIELAKSVSDGKIVVFFTFIFLGKSWYENFVQHSTCKSVLLLEKKNSLSKWVDEHEDIPDVLLVPIERTYWLDQEIRDMYRIMIIDEAHLFCTKENSQILLDWHPEYIIALTATINRSDGMFPMMEALAGTLVIRKSNRPFEVVKVEINLEPELEEGLSPMEIWQALSTWTATSEDWNTNVVDIINLIWEEDNTDEDAEKDENGEVIPSKILILVSRKAHVEYLNKLLTDFGIESSTYYGTAKSYNDAPVIIGTYKKMGTGFDEALACDDFNGRRFRRLITAFTLKDELMIEQSIGRVMRVFNPRIYDMVGSHRICQRHWGIRQKWMLKNGASITEIE